MLLLPPAEQTKVPDEQKLEHEENNQNPKKSRQGSRQILPVYYSYYYPLDKPDASPKGEKLRTPYYCE